MSGKPIYKYTIGRVEGAVWEKEYQGKKSYSVSFQKSWFDDKKKTWEHSSFFSQTDLRELSILVNYIAGRQVKKIETGHKQVTAVGVRKPAPMQQTDEEFAAEVLAGGDEAVPF